MASPNSATNKLIPLIGNSLNCVFLGLWNSIEPSWKRENAFEWNIQAWGSALAGESWVLFLRHSNGVSRRHLFTHDLLVSREPVCWRTKVGRLSFHRKRKVTGLTPRTSNILCFRGGGKGHWKEVAREFWWKATECGTQKWEGPHARSAPWARCPKGSVWQAWH